MPRRNPPNTYRLDEDSFYIGLPDGREAIIDAEDIGKVIGLRWRAVDRPNLRSRGTYGRRVTYVFPTSRIGEWPKPIHRFIMGTKAGKIIDHKNGDGLDNRKRNLRFVSNQQNMQNRSGSNTNSKSGVRGVSRFFNGQHEYWIVRVWLGNNHPSGKKSKIVYFPYNESGFEEACKAAPILRARYMTHAEDLP